MKNIKERVVNFIHEETKALETKNAHLRLVLAQNYVITLGVLLHHSERISGAWRIHRVAHFSGM